VLKTLALCLAILSAIGLVSTAYAQDNNVINSKYLTIQDHRLVDQDFSDTITGTVTNAAGTEVSASIYAILYDSNSQVISVEQGLTDLYPLPPNESSAFVINLFLQDNVDHYTLIPGGTPG
jgi:hypothetical protein